MKPPNAVLKDCVVLLYGSRSRGDHDEFSDADALVLSERPGHASLSRAVERLVATECGVPQELVSVSSYSFREMRRMASAGTLFARHIATESRVLVGEAAGLEAFKAALALLPSKAHPVQAADLLTYRTALRDVEEALDTALVDYQFELIELRTLLRHLSVLSSAADAAPTFGRSASFDLLVARYDLPVAWATEFCALFETATSDRQVVETWLERTHHCLLELERTSQEAAA